MTAPTKYDCTFDGPTACQWTQDSSNDQFDWRIHSGGTSSGFTGPKYDHTLQNSRGKNILYILIEFTLLQIHTLNFSYLQFCGSKETCRLPKFKILYG